MACSYPANRPNRTPNRPLVRSSVFGPLFRGAEPNNRTALGSQGNELRGYEQ